MGNESKHIEENGIFVLFKATDTKVNAHQKIKELKTSSAKKNPNLFTQF